MGRPAALCLLLAALLFPPAARADSWMAPGPKLDASGDGRWYVIVEPEKNDVSRARFRLVRRKAGAPPRAAPAWDPGREPAPSIEPEAGDEVLSRGACHMPMEVRCLDGGRGFVLFETYANLGHQIVLQRRDGQGKALWTKRLGDLFDEKQVRLFPSTVSSIWWYDGLWIEEEAGDVVVVHRGAPWPRLLRVGLSDGAQRSGRPKDALARLGRGSAEEQALALETARKLAVPGLLEAVRAAFAREDAPIEARVRYAVFLHENGDPAGRDLVVAAAAGGVSDDVRAFALGRLAALIGPAALPLLEAAMDSPTRAVRKGADEGFRALGAGAVDTLVRMALDAAGSVRSRRGAVDALWNLGAEAKPALAALDRVAKEAADAGLAAAARGAARHIRSQ